MRHGCAVARAGRGPGLACGHLLWQEWSPSWAFDELTFARTARSFDNPDFVSVVVHAYRFAFGLTSGDPQLKPWEDRLARRPRIQVPTALSRGLWRHVGEQLLMGEILGTVIAIEEGGLTSQNRARTSAVTVRSSTG